MISFVNLFNGNDGRKWLNFNFIDGESLYEKKKDSVDFDSVS